MCDELVVSVHGKVLHRRRVRRAKQLHDSTNKLRRRTNGLGIDPNSKWMHQSYWVLLVGLDHYTSGLAPVYERQPIVGHDNANCTSDAWSMGANRVHSHTVYSAADVSPNSIPHSATDVPADPTANANSSVGVRFGHYTAVHFAVQHVRSANQLSLSSRISVSEHWLSNHQFYSGECDDDEPMSVRNPPRKCDWRHYRHELGRLHRGKGRRRLD